MECGIGAKNRNLDINTESCKRGLECCYVGSRCEVNANHLRKMLVDGFSVLAYMVRVEYFFPVATTLHFLALL